MSLATADQFLIDSVDQEQTRKERGILCKKTQKYQFVNLSGAMVAVEFVVYIVLDCSTDFKREIYVG